VHDRGYRSGFVDGLSDENVCLDTYNEGTLARVYVAFIDKHPKYLRSAQGPGASACAQRCIPMLSEAKAIVAVPWRTFSYYDSAIHPAFGCNLLADVD